MTYELPATPADRTQETKNSETPCRHSDANEGLEKQTEMTLLICCLVLLFRARTTPRQRRRFTSIAAKYVFAEGIKHGERGEPSRRSSTAFARSPRRVDASARRCMILLQFSAGCGDPENFDNHRLLMSSNMNSRSLVCAPCNCAQMALADTRIAYQPDVDKHAGVLAYELVQGNLVQWNSFMDKSIPDPPTAVLLHGILGSRKNWGSFAKRLAQEFPMWQFLLVDLRCHGDSASTKKRGPHTVAATALDVLKLLVQLRLTPRVLVGHSFGGKVALSMVEQAAKPLARPVRVWVLDATPGKVRAGGDGEDHPAELIEFLRRMPTQVSSKQEVVDALVKEQFSMDVARWVATNLRRSSPLGQQPSSSFSWTFDLNGISEMYKSYEDTNLWRIVENVPRGVHINFLKAERSLHRWALEDLQRIHTAEEFAADEGGGVEMHVLEDAGHWVHADNPDGLFRILSSTFRIETTIRGMQD